MSTPTITSHAAPRRAHRRVLRTAAAVAGVAALIAAGGYAATTTFGPDAHEPRSAPAATGEFAIPGDQVQREMRIGVAGQCDLPAHAADLRPGRRVQLELDQAVADLYGPTD